MMETYAIDNIHLSLQIDGSTHTRPIKYYVEKSNELPIDFSNNLANEKCEKI